MEDTRRDQPIDPEAKTNDPGPPLFELVQASLEWVRPGDASLEILINRLENRS